jgi:uncharacterized membrane protein YeaQ/YmgE (transglycosylase-associated protein family)
MLAEAAGDALECAEQDATHRGGHIMVVNILLWCLFGLIAGAIAQFIMPGKDPGQSADLRGMAITIVIGIVGAAIGGLLCNPLFGWDVTGFNWQSILVAVAGALVLLILYRLVMSAARKS